MADLNQGFFRMPEKVLGGFSVATGHTWRPVICHSANRNISRRNEMEESSEKVLSRWDADSKRIFLDWAINKAKFVSFVSCVCLDLVTLLFRLMQLEVLAEQVTAVILRHAQQMHKDSFAQQTVSHVVGTNILLVVVYIYSQVYRRSLHKWAFIHASIIFADCRRHWTIGL